MSLGSLLCGGEYEKSDWENQLRTCMSLFTSFILIPLEPNFCCFSIFFIFNFLPFRGRYNVDKSVQVIEREKPSISRI